MEILQQDYERTMRERVEPFLAARREEGSVATADGLLVHYERYVNPNAAAGIVISHGFTESAEKFREMAFRMYVKGYSVFAIDHRGHGMSSRQVSDETLVHAEEFDRYADDLDRFIRKAVLDVNGDRPLMLFGHSMGGAIAARYLMLHPGVFRRAILNSPMIAVAPVATPDWANRAFASLVCAVGQSKRRMFGYSSEFDADVSFEKSCDTCRERFDYYQRKRVENSRLRTTSPTFGWVREALNVTKTLLNPENAAKIDCPVLLFQAALEDVVSMPAQDAFIKLLKQGELVRIENAKHEIYMSTDDVLEGYYRKLFDFFGKC